MHEKILTALNRARQRWCKQRRTDLSFYSICPQRLSNVLLTTWQGCTKEILLTLLDRKFQSKTLRDHISDVGVCRAGQNLWLSNALEDICSIVVLYVIFRNVKLGSSTLLQVIPNFWNIRTYFQQRIRLCIKYLYETQHSPTTPSVLHLKCPTTTCRQGI